jgi:hypothetical protein
MINIQQAVSAAMSYVDRFKELMPYEGVRLEEFNYDEDIGGQWVVTLSFVEPSPFAPGLMAPTRTYKTFTVDASSGNVMSMKIRNPLVAARN